MLLLVFKCLDSLGSAHLFNLLLSYQPLQILRSSDLLIIFTVRTRTRGEAAFWSPTME